jgi:hypothetical protein
MPKQSQSDNKQWEILILFGVLFLAIGGFCYFQKKKDDYIYDPNIRGVNVENTEHTEKVKQFFLNNGADLENSVTDHRSFLSCAACVNNWTTPAACNYCQQYVRGTELHRNAV